MNEQRILYDCHLTRTDVYELQVNEGGALSVYVESIHSRKVQIVFVNAKFFEVRWITPHDWLKDRSALRIARGIADEVDRIEQIYLMRSETVC